MPGLRSLGRVGETHRPLNQQHLTAVLDQGEQLFDVLVIKPDAAIRRPPPDLAGVMGAVDPIVGPAQVKRMGPQRIFRARTDEIGPFGVALLH